MRLVAIDEQVAVDRAVTEIEPRSIQVFVRTLGPVAHGQRRKQFAVSGIVSAVSQVKFSVVIFHLGSPERPGTVMSVGLRVSGACKSPMHQVRRSITVEPVVLTGRTDQVVNPAMAVDERVGHPDHISVRIADRIGITLPGNSGSTTKKREIRHDSQQPHSKPAPA